jgi:hypothetical protein
LDEVDNMSFEELFENTNKMLQEKITKIYNFCGKVNMLEFLSYSSVLSWISFDAKEGYKYLSPLEFEYLVGVFLNIPYSNSKRGKGTVEENGIILEDLNQLFPVWKLSNSLRKVNGKENERDISKALFEANIISVHGATRGYSFYNPDVRINIGQLKLVKSSV